MDKQQLRELLEKVPKDWNLEREEVTFEDGSGALIEWHISAPELQFTIEHTIPDYEPAETIAQGQVVMELICYLRNHAGELLEAAERADILAIADCAGHKRVSLQGPKVSKCVLCQLQEIAAHRDRLAGALRTIDGIVNDPERKLEYGTAEYFLVQRLRVVVSGAAEALKEAENEIA